MVRTFGVLGPTALTVPVVSGTGTSVIRSTADGNVGKELRNSDGSRTCV